MLAFFRNQSLHSIARSQSEAVSSTRFFFKIPTMLPEGLKKGMKHSILDQIPTWVTISYLNFSYNLIQILFQHLSF